MKRFLLILSYCCIATVAFTQYTKIPKGVGVEVLATFISPLQHPIKQTVTLKKRTWGASIGIEIPTFGKKKWHERCNFPTIGLELNVQEGGHPAIGYAIGLLPNVSTTIFSVKNLQGFARLGMGLGIVTNPFNRQSNTANNMIGSYLNNNTDFRVGLAWEATPKLAFRASFSAMHFSNARYTLPNLGVNFLGGDISIVFTPNPLEKEDFIYSMKPITRNQRIQLSALAGIGWAEHGTTNGPRYPIYKVAVDAGLFTGKRNRLKVGLGYEYRYVILAVMLHTSYQGTTNLSWRDASKYIAFLEDEIMIGPLGISLQMGMYLGTITALTPTRLVIGLGLRYYITEQYTARCSPFVFASLKAHQNVADYFALGGRV